MKRGVARELQGAIRVTTSWPEEQTQGKVFPDLSPGQSPRAEEHGPFLSLRFHALSFKSHTHFLLYSVYVHVGLNI